MRDALMRAHRRLAVRDTHGLLERAADLWGLAVAVPKCLEARVQQRIFVVLLERDTIHALLFLESQLPDQLGLFDPAGEFQRSGGTA